MNNISIPLTPDSNDIMNELMRMETDGNDYLTIIINFEEMLTKWINLNKDVTTSDLVNYLKKIQEVSNNPTHLISPHWMIICYMRFVLIHVKIEGKIFQINNTSFHNEIVHYLTIFKKQLAFEYRMFVTKWIQLDLKMKHEEKFLNSLHKIK